MSTFDQRIRLLRADTLNEVGSGVSGLNVNSIGFSPASDLMVIGDINGAVQVWNLEPFQLIDSRKVGAKTFQLTSLRHRAGFLTLTPEGLLIWAL